MSQSSVLSFDTEEAATKALHSLRSLEHEGKVHFEDTAVVTRDADGNAHVKNEASAATETGESALSLVTRRVDAGLLTAALRPYSGTVRPGCYPCSPRRPPSRLARL
jgi:hypothetical protein